VDWTRRDLTAPDGVRLALYDGGRADAPTMLFVHGYPDDHSVWDGVAERLAGDFRLVAVDVRGAGQSGVPGGRGGYRLSRLAVDLAAVATRVDAGPVHLVGHDWGSTQGWAAVTAPGAAERFASFTSISGPDLAMGGGWLRRAWLRRGWRTDRRAAMQQLTRSWYLAAFRLPVLPELFWRSGIGHRAIGRTRTAAGVADAIRGLELYRANLGPSPGRRPRRCEVPVQVLAPRHDRFVGVPMQTEAPAHWSTSLRTEIVDGGHWVLQRHPERIAGPIARFVATLPGSG
jgi:pimeloyl-ACP methyl ester carboxylesterase